MEHRRYSRTLGIGAALIVGAIIGSRQAPAHQRREADGRRGHPDSTACNVSTGSVANTGANAGCASSWGASDMVSNVWEWVADWVPRLTTCGSWTGGFGDDVQCLAGAATIGAPGAVIRGGSRFVVSDAGPFVVSAHDAPSGSSSLIGFREAR